MKEIDLLSFLGSLIKGRNKPTNMFRLSYLLISRHTFYKKVQVFGCHYINYVNVYVKTTLLKTACKFDTVPLETN